MNRYQIIKEIAVLSAKLLQEVQFCNQPKEEVEKEIENLCLACLKASQNPDAMLKRLTNHFDS